MFVSVRVQACVCVCVCVCACVCMCAHDTHARVRAHTCVSVCIEGGVGGVEGEKGGVGVGGRWGSEEGGRE